MLILRIHYCTADEAFAYFFEKLKKHILTLQNENVIQAFIQASLYEPVCKKAVIVTKNYESLHVECACFNGSDQDEIEQNPELSIELSGMLTRDLLDCVWKSVMIWSQIPTRLELFDDLVSEEEDKNVND